MSRAGRPSRSRPPPPSSSSGASEGGKEKRKSGFLLTCDPPLKEFLKHLEEVDRCFFIIEDLDDTHLFLSAKESTRNGRCYPLGFDNLEHYLRTKVAEWMAQFSYIDDTDNPEEEH